MRFLIVVSLLIAGWSLHAADPDQPEVVRIGFATIGLNGRLVAPLSPIATAQHQGLIDARFKEHGIRIDWNFYKGAGPAVNEALANGQLDFAWQGDLPGIVGRASGLKTKLLLAQHQRANSFLVAPLDSPANSIADLVGKRVAMFKGTNLQLAVGKALTANGLTERDFKSINLEASAGLAAFSAKELDGLWGGLELLPLILNKQVKLIYSTRGQSPVLTKQTDLLVTEDFEQRYPKVVQLLVDVLVEQAHWESDESHRDELFRTWSDVGLPAAVFAAEFEGSALRDRQSPLLDEFFIDQYRTSARTAYELRLIRSQIDVDSWFEPKYLNEALHRQHLEGFWTSYAANGTPAALTTGTSATTAAITH